MAIVKNNFRVSRLSPKDGMSTDEDELRRQSSASEGSEEGSEFDDEEDEDADSGMGSDDVDLSELGEVGEELCQVGSQLCSVPFELYDLEGLSEILSVDVWNECLSEEERFGLAKYLPDMDQEAFVRTMKELFSGENFHFGSPIVKLFEMMKGGMCEPRVMLYQHGWSCFQKFRHYHQLREYQSCMVGKFVGINNAWSSCKGYGIEERLRVLKLMGSQKSLMYDKREDMVLGSDSSGREELGDGLWTKKLKEDRHGSKRAHHHMYMGSPTVDASSQERNVSPELTKYGKQNPKGLLKLAGSKVPSEENLMGSYPSSHRGLELKSRPYGLSPTMLRKEPVVGYDVGAARQVTGVPKVGKQREFIPSEDGFADDTLIGIPLSLKHDNLHSQRKKWNANHMAEMTMNHDRGSLNSRDTGKKAKYYDKSQYALAEDEIYNAKGRAQPPLSKAIPVDGFSRNQTFRHFTVKEESNPSDHQVIADWNVRGDKWKMQPEFRSNRNNVGSNMFPPSSHRSEKLEKKIKRESLQHGFDLEEYTQSDETESDSSDHVDEEEDTILRRSKQGYPVLANKLPKKENIYGMPLPGVSYSAKAQNDDLGDRMHLQDVEVYTLKGKQKGKIHDPRYLHNYSTGISEESGFSDLAKMAGTGKKAYKSPKIDHMQFKTNPSMKNKKGFVDQEYYVPRSSYAHSYMDEDGDLHVTPSPTYLGDSTKTDRMGRRGQSTDHHERSSMPLLECSSASKKRKGKVDVTYMSGLTESEMYASPQQQIDDPSALKKRGKRDLEAESDSLVMISSEKGLVDGDSETKPGKKPFTLITPSVHTGFSFSIIHLLSAVRVAMVTPLADDVLDIGTHIEQNGTHEPVSGKSLAQSQDIMDSSVSEQVAKNMPSLTVQEIVNRVRSNPGDPCILETQEPLQDLVRGVLKIFASKTAPLGAKGWKALVSYEKSTKSWSWIGPISSSTPDPDTVEEVTSYEVWGLPHKMLVKLVDSFANWLKNGQDTLQQIGSLPAPPLALMQPNLDEKERFRDLRAQKSLTTITPSSEEVRAYFRKEEILRYLVPDRAFSYTAADGKKSIVAPLRRGGGKPTSKARDHPILKPDRPPHVTILCLVRDAAARLPGSIGTRADVCTLIRDSQYIVEDVTDAQVNQVVSGALDRLHYERDPCVQFDGERKLWVYLHRDREEEDFEDDGTSSTKKWKRPRKDAAEQSDAAILNAGYHGIGEQLPDGSEVVYMISTDVKAELSSTQAGQGTDLIYNGLRPNEDVNVGPFVGSERDRLHQGWEVLNLNPMRENKMICQENSTNEDYDEAFNRDRSVGLFNTSIKNGVR